MPFRILAGLLIAILASETLHRGITLWLGLPDGAFASETFESLVLAPPVMVIGFAIGFTLVGRFLKKKSA